MEARKLLTSSRESAALVLLDELLFSSVGEEVTGRSEVGSGEEAGVSDRAGVVLLDVSFEFAISRMIRKTATTAITIQGRLLGRLATGAVGAVCAATEGRGAAAAA